MREITCGEITDMVEKLCIKAATVIPPDIEERIIAAIDNEDSYAGRSALKDIRANYICAEEEGLPICQDTGMTVVFAEIGQDCHITGGEFNDAVNEGVRRGYINGNLRKSVVHDHFNRINSNDNTPAVIHVKIVHGGKIRLTVSPKGFGSENKSAMRMFLPSATRGEIEDFVVDTAAKAGGDPCPPMIIGVGIGGTVEMAALLAKRALIRPLDIRNYDEIYALMEESILRKVNKLGIGPQGYGGNTTALAVNIMTYACHIAGTACVVNIGCHATRHASGVI